jgi:hypothetical protein
MFFKESMLLLFYVNSGLAARFVFEQFIIANLDGDYRSIFLKVWILTNIGLTIGSGAIRNVILQHHNRNIYDTVSFIGINTIFKTLPIQFLALIAMAHIIGVYQFVTFLAVAALSLIIIIYEINVQIKRVKNGALIYSFWGFIYQNFCILFLLLVLNFFNFHNLYTIMSVIAVVHLLGILVMTEPRSRSIVVARDNNTEVNNVKREYWLAVLLYISWIIKERSLLLAFGNQNWENELVSLFLAFRVVQILSSFKSAVYNFLISRVGKKNFTDTDFQNTYIYTVYVTSLFFLAVAIVFIYLFEILFDYFGIIYFEDFYIYLKLLIFLNLILTSLGPFQTINQVTNKTIVELIGASALIFIFIILFLVAVNLSALGLLYCFVIASILVEFVKFFVSTNAQTYFGVRRHIYICATFTSVIWFLI